MNPSKEKRTFPRLSMYLPLEYQVIDIPYVHKGSIVNASNERFLIYSTENIPVSTILNIVVLFPKAFELNNFKVAAEIVWGQRPNTATPFLAEMGEVDNYSSHKKIIPYAGINSSIHQKRIRSALGF